ncbi:MULTISPECIES: enoyl-CoA hydratase-related protein [Paraburkholderia]|uniref:Enoyl-CoA hydratase-related protein n=1 Tax=Paraburkholderia madseniana TaxID=2599607 RepID=A0AAP5EY89_9BURK|nr:MULTISPECIES: enoyl-CoA hydratase-related protein [Paraburkholderia]MCX4149922.1 enoyl-CoA hydratase-related protein [Paraburkholderia madseniana]MDN7152858.1 enoyl-CoA hydratase-related protein [Paraburkholderia sp. WS6]MDQ6411740.1 enoyl-CoA hydratase-related protein [Paraburkholderia madseniana]
MELKVTAYEVDTDGVATVRFNRPDRGNSWTTRMNAEYRHIMALLDADPAVRVVVLTGAGKQFCVGADFKALDLYAGGDKDYIVSVRPDDFAQPGHGVRDEFNHELVWHWGLRKPVIAAINGACAGIAVAIAGFCDLRYAIEGAKLTTATARLGLPAEYGLAWILPRLMGVTHAADVLLTGRIFLAEEARHMGFLNDVFSVEEFDARVKAIARTIATTVSPQAALTTKRQLYGELMELNVGECIEQSKVLINELMRGGDYREGVEALQQRRLPRFDSLPGSRS